MSDIRIKLNVKIDYLTDFDYVGADLKDAIAILTYIQNKPEETK